MDEPEGNYSERMVEAIRSKKTSRSIFARGKPEVTFRKKMASFAVQSRCDWFDDFLDDQRRPLIVDLKSIDQRGESDRQFLKFNYYYNAAYYQLVVNSALTLEDVYPRYLFVVSEKEEPFDVAFREPDEISLEVGRQEVMRDLGKLKTCYDQNLWPAAPDEIRPVSLPDWKIANLIL